MKTGIIVESLIRKRIETANSLILKTHGISDRVENRLRESVFGVLEKIGMLGIKDTVYTITKELVINACKANHKRIYLQRDENSRTEGLKYHEADVSGFRATLVEKEMIRYGVIARSEGLYVLIQFAFNEDELIIEIINNVPMLIDEQEMINENIKRAMFYNSIADYYLNNQDIGSEGEGLGIAMIIVLLKAEGIDPRGFQIYSDNEKTVARVRLPVTNQI